MKKIIVFLFYSLSLCVLAGCFASGMSSKNDTKWIPADFDPKNTILLVEKNYSMTPLEKEIEEYMKKNYPYRFEFALGPSIRLKAGKYSDTVLYRYALVRNSDYIHGGGHASQREDFNFYDMIHDKDYSPSGKQSSKKVDTFKRVVDALISYYYK